jgi:hypothetical protein
VAAAVELAEVEAADAAMDGDEVAYDDGDGEGSADGQDETEVGGKEEGRQERHDGVDEGGEDVDDEEVDEEADAEAAEAGDVVGSLAVPEGPPPGAGHGDREGSTLVRQRRASSLIRRGLLPPQAKALPADAGAGVRGALLAQIRGGAEGTAKQLRHVRRVSVARVATMSKDTEASVLGKLKAALASRRAMISDHAKPPDDSSDDSQSDWSDD